MAIRVNSKQKVSELLAILKTEFGKVLPPGTKKSVILEALKKEGASIDYVAPETGEEASEKDAKNAALNNSEDLDDDSESEYESPQELQARQLKESRAKDQALRDKMPLGYLINIHEKDGEQDMVPVRAQNSLIYIRRGMDVVVSRAHFNVLNNAKRREARDKENERGELIRVTKQVPRHSMDVSERFFGREDFEAAKKHYNTQKAEQ